MSRDPLIEHDGHAITLTGISDRRGFPCRASVLCDYRALTVNDTRDAMAIAIAMRDEHEQIVHEYLHRVEPTPGALGKEWGFTKNGRSLLGRRAHRGELGPA